jgi:hypothetical protein
MKMMSWRERFAWVGFMALIFGGLALAASEPAPFVVMDSTGRYYLHVLDTSGYLQNAGAKQRTPTTNWALKNSAGTSTAGWHYNGCLIVGVSDHVSRTPVANGTAEVTVTYATAEPDTNYYIVGGMEDATADVTATMWVKRRAAGTFCIGSSNVNSGTAYYTWQKVRTQ